MARPEKFPYVVNCGDPLASAFPSARTVIAHGVQRFAGRTVPVELVHRLSGYTIAGSAMRWDDAAWGCIIRRQDGTTGGQWYKTRAEARADFNRRTGTEG